MSNYIFLRVIYIYKQTTANLYLIHKPCTLTYPSINKSKFKTHPGYIVKVSKQIERKVYPNLHLMKGSF